MPLQDTDPTSSFGGFGVKQEFLKLGLNPGGNGYRQNYYSVPVGNGEERHRWSECYDWSQTDPADQTRVTSSGWTTA